MPPRLITMNRSLIFPSGLAFCLVLSAAFGQEQPPSGYDSAKLPKGRDYFELRDGLANARRKFAVEKKGRIAFLGGSIKL